MEPKFWINAWKEGRTAFHLKDFNQKLVKYFPDLNPRPGQKVLVPLCGKSKDLLWLYQQGLIVQGIELYETAVKDFFQENNLPAPAIKEDSHHKHFSLDRLTITCGDFFEFKEKDAFDFIYDRASLVALPESMRPEYVRILREALKPGGKYLLLSFEYPQGTLEGPPFSITEEEIHSLYGDHFTITLLESEKPAGENSRIGSVSSVFQKVYMLELKK